MLIKVSSRPNLRMPPPPRVQIVAQSADFIAKEAGIAIPDGTKFFIVPEVGFGKAYPFSGEKMSVTMALYRIPDDIDAAIYYTNGIQEYQARERLTQLFQPRTSTQTR